MIVWGITSLLKRILCNPLFVVASLAMSVVCVADVQVLHVGGATINLLTTCNSEHKLNIKYGNTVYCAPATTEVLTGALHVLYNGTVYSVCNGECGGGEEYEIPTTPSKPIQLNPSCAWTQSNANAYLSTDGNQYFDTDVPVSNDKELSITAQITNGASARMYGTIGSSCRYDMTVDAYGEMQFRIGTSNYGTSVNGSDMESKHTWITRNHPSGPTKKNIYQDNESKKLDQMNSYKCSTNNPIYLLNNDWSAVSSTNVGVKLYSFKIWDVNGTLLHDYYPVKSGTVLPNCASGGGNYVAPTNCLYDSVAKQILLPGGTGQVGFGSD